MDRDVSLIRGADNTLCLPECAETIFRFAQLNRESFQLCAEKSARASAFRLPNVVPRGDKAAHEDIRHVANADRIGALEFHLNDVGIAAATRNLEGRR